MDGHRIDIRWRDLDKFGHVNAAVFVTYVEETRDAWFRQVLGLAPGEVWDYVLVRLTLEYRSELRQTDVGVIGTCRVERIGNSSITTREQIHAQDGRLAAETESVLVVWDPEQRASRPLTDAERTALER